MARFWWATATGVAVVAALIAVVVYELLVVGPQGASVSEAAKSHLFILVVVATAGAAATAFLSLGAGAGTALTAVVLGTAAGGGVAVLLAFVSGTGPDEGDGFFWLTVASLVISVVAAGVATLVATRLRRA